MTQSKRQSIIVLSARNADRLQEYARRVLTALHEQAFSDADLVRMAYTLQVGREAMNERLAMLVVSLNDLEEKLRGFVDGQKPLDDVYRGQVKSNKEMIATLTADDDMAGAIDTWVAKGKYAKLADLWTKGLDFDWNMLYGESKPRRISLPTYPYARNRYWIDGLNFDQKLTAEQMREWEFHEETEPVMEVPIETDSQYAPGTEVQETYELMTFEEVWQEQALQETDRLTTDATAQTPLVCFLSNPEAQHTILQELPGADQSENVIFLSQGTEYKKGSRFRYLISPTERAAYRQAFESIREDFGHVHVVLYLWPLEDPKCLREYSYIVSLLQALASTKLKPERLLLAAQFENGLERCYWESWVGFERSLGLVLPNTRVSAIAQEGQDIDIHDWTQKLRIELHAPESQSVLYQEGKRHVCRTRPTTLQSGESLLKSGGTYLITGGCGGLGLLFAHHLAATHSVKLILSGRSPLDEDKQSQIRALEASGSQVAYVQADVCDLPRMKEGLERAKEDFGGIDGVIHAAGLESRQSVLEEEIQRFQQVLAPKITGTLALDDVLREEALDFICYFSSSSAILGDFGSCNYAIGNRFQLAYAQHRNQQQAQGQRQGKAIAIAWPLWRAGGMGFGEDEQSRMYLQSSGQRFLEAEEGLALFDRLLAQETTQHLVLAGQPGRVNRFLGLSPAHAPGSDSTVVRSSGKGRRAEMKGWSVPQCLEWDLKEQISVLLKIPRDQLDRETNLADFGFDSVTLAEFATLLSEHYSIDITPALFFEHSTLEHLIRYFLTDHQETLETFYQEEQAAPIRPPVRQAAVMPAKKTKPKGFALADRSLSSNIPEPIAIIGMSGRFPEARTIDAMWNILVEGRDVVQEIPADRWELDDFFHSDQKVASAQGKSYSKWCGCLPGVGEFDPLFFEISPSEAELMDPRQRLLLQESWKALEDAGYGINQIRTSTIGMFVGAEDGDYQQLARGQGSITSNHTGILAARLAYFLDLSGPVLAINTACSSGLVAVHQACASLRTGECDTAIAAAANLMLAPESYVLMSQAGMLSKDGTCFTFDTRANGMVPGEAVAVVVLKRLSQAQADGDPIYAVIKGSGVNYDGKTNGITAPNGGAQRELLKAVYEQCRVHPEAIDYIVTHGTGTKLGDPIEINALYDAFKDTTTKQQYCALTSTKTNFGHTFAASGLVSLVSLVQALRHETIPASLHCEQENEYINWKASPFFINKTKRAWPQQHETPRIGAVSAFGMSGTNAHLVVQDYSMGDAETPAQQAPYYLLALSAKTQEALQEKIEGMLAALHNTDAPQHSLSQISYTLLEGRRHFKHRCAIVIRDHDDAVSIWKQAGGNEKLPNLFQGTVPRNFTAQPVLQQYAQDLLRQSQTMKEREAEYKDVLCALADLYCQGYELPWEQLYGDALPRRIHLPTYPFSRKHYWIDNLQSFNLSPDRLHPLLHRNTSDFSEQRFSSTFTGQEFFLKDHVVQGQPVLPGAAHIEMACAAGEIAGGRKIQAIKNVIWTKPIQVKEQPQDVHISLYPGQVQVEYEVTDEQREVCSQGVLAYEHGDTLPETPAIDVEALKIRCPRGLNRADFYPLFEPLGLQYGAGFQPIEELWYSDTEALSRLTLSQHLHETFGDFGLHPSLLDGALQTALGVLQNTDIHGPLLPIAVGEVELIRALSETCYAHVKLVKTGHVSTFHIQVLDPSGQLLVRIRDFSVRANVRTDTEAPTQVPVVEREDAVETTQPQTAEAEAPADEGDILCQVQQHVVHTVSGILKVNEDDIELDAEMSEYGFDSINLTTLVNQINETYHLDVMPAIFFEHPSIGSFAAYLRQEYADAFTRYYQAHAKTAKTVKTASPPAQTEVAKHKAVVRRPKARFYAPSGRDPYRSHEPIAVIGISGVMPQSEDLQEFWEHLKNGDDLITEIPRERWDWQAYYGDPTTEANKTNVKWGGFMKSADTFDAAFFNISPREAQLMDPQQRILLQTVWKCIEDAGYKASDVSGTKMGLFVGVATSDYGDLLQMLGVAVEAYSSTGITHSILTNRISYLLNLHGPSEPVDTACSSSLVATHRAIMSLHNGECDTAIAGGVNVLLTPKLYISFNKAGMLSPDGRCKTFDQRANGYIRGEGVGAVFLKPVSQARADGDHIYGVIKGSAVNHGGHVSSLTAPNPNAQAELLIEAYEKADIDPATITYIEAHGTATELGDPIEVNGLKKALTALYESKGRALPATKHCGLSSVKTNIGHLEAAAGIAGMLKVLLAMKHKTLPGTVHLQTVNPQIQLEDTPLYLVKQTTPWQAVEDNAGRPVPRRAGVSSFGFGGANAHVVIEEYEELRPVLSEVEGITNDELRIGDPSTSLRAGPHILVLSARNEERLKAYAQDLADFLETAEDVIDLAAVAYTLQIGREVMQERLAVVASSVEEFTTRLRQYVQGRSNTEHTHTGNVTKKRQKIEEPVPGSSETELIKAALEHGEFDNIARLWVAGSEIDWQLLYLNARPHRVSLPTYPFAPKRHWIPESNNLTSHISHLTSKILHPLLHQNTSDLSEQRFSSTFTGREFFLADHMVQGQRVLPGAACVEMARAAVERAAGDLTSEQRQVRLTNVVWSRPIVVGAQPIPVHIGLFPEENGGISFEIYQDVEAQNTSVNCQGNAVLSLAAERPVLDINALQAACRQRTLSAAQCYETFRAMGIEYGAGHQGIEAVYIGADQVLAKLSLPASVADTHDQFVLHPSMLDAALQASIGLMPDADSSKPILPFALQQLEVFAPCTSDMWALLRYSDGSQAGDKVLKLNIDICDEQGAVCIRLTGFSARVLEGGMGSEIVPALSDAQKTSDSPETEGVLMLKPYWDKQSIAPEAAVPEYEQHLIILCERDNLTQERIAAAMQGVRCLSLQSGQTAIEERFETYAVQVFEELQRILSGPPRGEVLVQLVVSPQGERKLFSALAGLLKTVRFEHPKLNGQVIEVDAGEDTERLIGKLQENSRCPDDTEIRYQDGQRLVAGWHEFAPSQAAIRMPWKERGVYLITGGTGGLGRIFAEDIARQVKGATLILTGRAALNEEKRAQVNELEKTGVTVEYRQVDVTDREMVEGVIRHIQEDFGSLNGIIHCAGVIHDNFILKKTPEELRTVLAPKVAGLVNLDDAGKNLPLDVFLLFSSIAGSLGNAGQADYATANAFLDAYAQYRNSLVAAGQRRGLALSVNWPLWKEGGMQVPEAAEKMMWQRTGMLPMQTSTGIRALYEALASGEERVMVMEGSLARMKEKLLVTTRITPPTVETPPASDAVAEIDTGTLHEQVKRMLAQNVSTLLRVDIADIDDEAEFNDFGFDSISLTDFANLLNREYALDLTPTIFFEHSTLRDFARYLTEEYQALFAAQFVVQTRSEAPPSPVKDTVERPVAVKRRLRFAGTPEVSASQKGQTTPAAIAVIGMSGRFPMAADLHEFWQNLLAGRDCITEIPPNRWDWRAYYGDPTRETNKTTVKWGGFIDGVDEFDPFFFGISPREAELMDPQQRLLMLYAWKAIEDAGYSAQSLSGSNTGIFVGTGNSGYHDLLSRANVAIEGYTSTGTVPSVGPNRMSYTLDIHGPSEPIETACSSSLIALHRAVTAIELGNCEMAIVGGVNTIVTPEAHISFNKAGMLSEDGRCKTFSAQANGYVRGEGVGMLILKKLTAAEEVGDHIYGVIRSSAENHGGRANSLTAPNPKAQAELLKTAYRKAGIDPRTVSYIEAHGTGTPLGDPIEINGLKTAFKDLYQATGDPQVADAHCGLGSVKTNIGHLEFAAGIAGIFKVLLQLQHNTLVKSLHSETINPYIQLQDSPFYIVQETRDWQPLHDARGNDLPRRAGVSSFGFGGANAHIVIEEYVKPETGPFDSAQDDWKPETGNPAIILLSAKNADCLHEHAQQLLSAIQEQKFSDADLADMAYTLQVGRDAMEERLAVIVTGMSELEKALKDFVEGQDGIKNLYRGQVKRNKEALAVFAADEELREAVDKWIHRKKYSKLVDFWVKGLQVDWSKLHGETTPRRISLPTYPFATKRYWIPESEQTAINRQSSIFNIQSKRLHPLVGRNISTLQEEKFATQLTGDEFYLSDHQVNGQKILPGVAYIEMARAAGKLAGIGEIAGAGGIHSIRNILWAQPISVEDQPQDVRISLSPKQNRVEYEVSIAAADHQRILCSRGKLFFNSHDGTLPKSETIDLDAVKTRCANTKDRPECYALFDALGLQYGPGFQPIETLSYNDAEALSRLKLPSHLHETFHDFVLHPTLMDGALQTVLGLMQGTENSGLFLPFALGNVEIIQPLPETCYAYATRTKAGKVNTFTIRLLDSSGQVVVRLTDFSMRAVSQTTTSATAVVEPAASDVMYFEPVWETEPTPEVSEKKSSAPVLIFDTDETLFQHCKNALATEGIILVKPGEQYQDTGNNTYLVNPEKREDYGLLIRTLHDSGMLPGRIVYLWSKADSSGDSIDANAPPAIYPLLYLSQAMMEHKPKAPVRLLYLYAQREDAGNTSAFHAAISGFARTIRLENPKFVYKTVDVENVSETEAVLDNVLKEFQADDHMVEIQYKHGERQVRQFREYERATDAVNEVPLKERGVYLITGGFGALGLIFANYLTRHWRARLVLTGRSALSAEKETILKEMQEAGAEVLYVSADISKRDDVRRVIAEAKSRFNGIDGIIHAAGVLRDALILKKTDAELEAVFAPKIQGTLHLDEATRDDALDFFALFSSVAGAMGNLGQCDYAYANSFMDHFARIREDLREKGERAGKTLSINWPLWLEGGMAPDEQSIAWLEKKTGMTPLQTEQGIEAFVNALAFETNQVLVAQGEREKVYGWLGIARDLTPRPPLLEGEGEQELPSPLRRGAGGEVPPPEALQQKVEADLIQLFCDLLKVEAEDVERDVEVIEYGVDSIMMMSVLNKIEEMYGETVEPNALSEYPTIRRFAGYLIEEQIVKPSELTPQPGVQTPGSKRKDVKAPYEADNSRLQPASAFSLGFEPQVGGEVLPQSPGNRFIQDAAPEPDKIAIIGMAGRFPGAKDIESFWQNLRQGQDSIIEVPPDRWSIAEYYSPDKNAPGKSYSKWGGYVEDVDLFDAEYFGISDGDALTMDPQQRIVLELSQELLDRAGYAKGDIAKTNTGIFLGGAESPYVQKNLSKIPPEYMKHVVINTIQNMMAARISDFYNLTGASQTVDTACSSALVAIHQACQEILAGRCGMAIAGGIELLIDPLPHIGFSKSGALSDEGRLYVFDKRAKGIVLGEGAGLALLKSYRQAVEDGDRILGVIAGSAVNNDGHTMGLTVPNLEGQKAVIQAALDQSGVNPETITCLEAHGTGTLLGDPIEIKAITQIYRKFTQDAQYCAVGSVKSNIGHLLHAAGMASLIKVLLALQHKQIPPTLHCETPHPRFKFEASPFYPVTELTDWVPKGSLRRAAISSFGFGGTNCHLILEEFPEADVQDYVRRKEPLAPTQFHRKRYWIGKEIVETPEPDTTTFDTTSYANILKKLRQGEITSEKAMQLRSKHS